MKPRSGFHRVLLLAAFAMALVAMVGAWPQASRAHTGTARARGHAPAHQASARPRRPNIVFVLTDDLSWNLVRFMPEVRRMRRDGATFTNYFVTSSLCCSSRASIFTGRY